MIAVEPRPLESFVPVVFAEKQPEYNPLPALRNSRGDVVTEWQPSAEELDALMRGGTVRLTQLTFNTALQPIKLEVYEP